MDIALAEKSSAHPCARGNFENAKNLIKLYRFYEHTKPGIWVYRFCDYDPLTNMLKEAKYIGFYGDHNGYRFGRNVSFHQPTLDFEKEIGEMLLFLTHNGYCERADREPSLPESPTDKHRKKSYSLARQYPSTNDPFKCIVAHKDHVEVRNNMKKWEIRYDLSESEWQKQTGWKS